ncbi:MAG TPA: group 1 truncated hemoglobin [Gemmatimonadaceae bacterium]|nr:group 1 truncated hemoglobin [Gemmatimonadaceae bacterium]
MFGFHSRRFTQLAAFAMALSACNNAEKAAADSAAAKATADSAAAAAAPAATTLSLYDRLGGRDAIIAVVDDFVANVAADKRINARFAKTDIPHLKQMLVDQICSATGGTCTYTGNSMKDAHKGMKITDADFTALVEDLTASLDKHKVAAIDKDELLTALGGMKGDIVGQ